MYYFIELFHFFIIIYVLTKTGSRDAFTRSLLAIGGACASSKSKFQSQCGVLARELRPHTAGSPLYSQSDSTEYFKSV